MEWKEVYLVEGLVNGPDDGYEGASLGMLVQMIKDDADAGALCMKGNPNVQAFQRAYVAQHGGNLGGVNGVYDGDYGPKTAKAARSVDPSAPAGCAAFMPAGGGGDVTPPHHDDPPPPPAPDGGWWSKLPTLGKVAVAVVGGGVVVVGLGAVLLALPEKKERMYKPFG